MKQNQSWRLMCVGPEKTGTCWLYSKLIMHPDVFLPNYKEINYFVGNKKFATGNLFKRCFSSFWYYASIRKYMMGHLKYYLKHPNYIFRKRNLGDIRWDLKFFFGRRTDQWYQSITSQKGKKIIGEIAPLYAFLSLDEIAQICQLFPNLRVIILLRNPVHRLWSKAKMNLSTGSHGDISHISDEAFYSCVNRDLKQIPSYLNLIEKWSTSLPAGNVHVNFFDKLEEDPKLFLKEISEFLNIDYSLFPPAVMNSIGKKENEGRSIQIPEAYAKYLATKCRDSIKKLCQQYDGYPDKWLSSINAILSKGDS